MNRLLIASGLTCALACASGCIGTPWSKYRSNLANNGLGSTSPTTGTVKWKFQTTGLILTAPALDANNLYFGSDDTNFYAVSKGGQKVWLFGTGGRVESSAAVANGVVYFGSSDKNVYALTTAGAKLWSFATGSDVFSSPAFGGISIPVTDPKLRGTFVNQNIVVIGGMDNNVYAIDADTGKRRWFFATGGPVQSSPAWSPSGNIYIGSYDHNVYALDPTNGSKVWMFTTNGKVDATPAIGTDGTVYIPSQDGNLYALDGATGNKKWAFAPPGSPANNSVSPAVLFSSNVDTIFSGNSNGFFAVDASGNQIWLNTDWAGLGTLSPAAVTRDPTLYVGSFTGFDNTSTFLAANAITGKGRWFHVALNGGLFTGGAAIDTDGTVYAGCTDGNMYAFQ